MMAAATFRADLAGGSAIIPAMQDDGLIYSCGLCADDHQQPDGTYLDWWTFAPLKYSLAKVIAHAYDYHRVPGDT